MIFDLDGVLLDSEQLWNRSKQEVTAARGGSWSDDAPHDMMGMSSGEWTAYMRDALGVSGEPEEINRAVVDAMRELYREQLPLLPGAREAVAAIGARWPIGLASSSNREIIDLVVAEAGFEFAAIVSSEEVARGKPSPDVYLKAAAELGIEPERCAAIEDSSNGIRAAHAAGMPVVAVPNAHYPPEPDALDLAAVTIDSVQALTVDLIRKL